MEYLNLPDFLREICLICNSISIYSTVSVHRFGFGTKLITTVLSLLMLQAQDTTQAPADETVSQMIRVS